MSVPLGSVVMKVISLDPKRHYSGSKFTYLDIGAVDQDAKQIRNAKAVSASDAPSRARQLLKAGDILISTVRPNLNAVAIVPEELEGSIASTGFCVLRPDPSKADAAFLFHWVKSKIFVEDMVRKATGASYPAVSDRIILESAVPLPSLEEQRRLAAILDQAEELRAKRCAAIALLDKLPEAIFLEMFGDVSAIEDRWNAKGFEEAAVIDTRMTSDFETYADYYHIGIENIEKQSGEIVSPRLVKDIALISGKYLFDERHLIYSKIRPNLNKVAAPEFKGVCSADAYPILPRDGICNREYLVMVLRSDFFLSYILGQSSRTNIPKINKKQLLGFTIPLPPFELQRCYADRVDVVRRAKAVHRSALAESTALFTTLQAQCFGGADAG